MTVGVPLSRGLNTMPDQVVEGIYRIQLPLPFALNIVNCYLLRGASGWTIVDTGINTPAGRETWRKAFEELHITIKDIEKIVLTHTHPDHYGLGGWLQSLAEDIGHHIPAYLSQEESRQVGHIWSEIDKEWFSEYLEHGGVTPDILENVSESMIHTMRMTQPPIHDTHIISPGHTIRMGERPFEIIRTPGHSDGHLIFYNADDQIVLCGDHVLMKITPNIGLWSWTDQNPLDSFLTSLRDLHRLKIRLALPGHKTLITDWDGRLDELYEHHLHRLEKTLEAVSNGFKTGYEVAHHIFDTSRFTVHEWRFAVAETLAHLEYLRHRGQLTRDDESVWHYTI
jgi:glyoxylase-like metal-dependent hydrolase (beta-lactamase superfamily II)